MDCAKRSAHSTARPGRGGRDRLRVPPIPSQRVASGFYSAALTALGVARVIPIHVSRERPLRTADLTRATGVLVGGGRAPAYHTALVPTADE